MDDDLVQTVLYILIALIGVIGSAYQNMQKKKKAQGTPSARPMPRDIMAEPQQEFDFGPLLDVFDIPPRRQQAETVAETVESGPSVEEGGDLVDSKEAAAEMDGLKMAREANSLDVVPETESFEEGQSDIQKMIARFEELGKEYNQETGADAISEGAIVSHEEDLARQERDRENERFFNPRKAIIYAEILKRKEF
jgi:hypothetical protein